MNEKLLNFLKKNENINYSVLESLLTQIKAEEDKKEEETEPTEPKDEPTEPVEDTDDPELEQENNINQAKSIADSLKDSI